MATLWNCLHSAPQTHVRLAETTRLLKVWGKLYIIQLFEDQRASVPKQSCPARDTCYIKCVMFINVSSCIIWVIVHYVGSEEQYLHKTLVSTKLKETVYLQGRLGTLAVTVGSVPHRKNMSVFLKIPLLIFHK